MNTPSSPSRPSRHTRRGRKVWSGTQQVIAHGMPSLGWRDIYHHALAVNWPTFFAALATLFLASQGRAVPACAPAVSAGRGTPPHRV